MSYGAGNARDAMHTGFMELGLDSVDVVQRLSKRVDIPIDPRMRHAFGQAAVLISPF